MRFDRFDDLLPANAIDITAVSGDGTTQGNALDVRATDEDLKGQSLVLIFQVQGYTDGTYTPLIEDSDDGITYAAVADDFLKGTEAGAALSAEGLSKIGYLGDKKYIRASIVASSVTTGATINGIAIFQDREQTDFTTQTY